MTSADDTFAHELVATTFKRRAIEAERQLHHVLAENRQMHEANDRLRAMLRNAIVNCKRARRNAVRAAIDGLLEQRAVLRKQLAAFQGATADLAIVARVSSDRLTEMARRCASDEDGYMARADEIAELRGDVMALWQRLGDVLGLVDSKAYMTAERQAVLANARQLHALWSDVPDLTDKQRAMASGWTGDRWLWCGGCESYGSCSVVTCTNHEDAPR